ncbi:MAG: isoaspartyl peptidase/L-asparaginase [Candidatus Thorarchaeota archaeon]|nr:MAG: isoaspartyl peptidase/L-asparaginase [Candidatus Thorarchaeota archaeon]
MSLPVVLVHGGATKFKKESHDDVLKAVERAAEVGFCVLERGGSGLDSAEATIRSLESTTLFTAGLGAEPNLDGEIELDAIVMDGNRLESGAVMAVQNTVHPISLARYVLERTPNAQIAGSGADKLYRKMIQEGYREESTAGRPTGPRISEGCDTVGCIVVDANGYLVAASSTSGWGGMLPGRVGDTPVIGSGVYANEIAAACSTGRGEQILRIVMSRIAVHYVEDGFSVTEAVQKTMRVLREKTTGEAGLIMADSQGNVSLGFDTPHMPVALHGEAGLVYSSLTPDDFPSTT